MERLIRWSLCSAVLLTTTASAAIVTPGQSCGEATCGDTICGEGCNEGCDSTKSKRNKNGNCEGVYRLSKGQQRRLNKQCPPIVRRAAYGIDWAHNCGPIGQAARLRIPGARRLQTLCRTKGSGDSGWAPPSRSPINRTHTGYGSYSNMGNGYAGAPMVYQPTDTAQLGYSYAHVPTWQRRPNMIPRPPIPSMMHNRSCPGMSCGSGAYCSAGGPCGACMSGSCNSGACGGAVNNYSGSYCPSCQASATPVATPQMAAAPQVFSPPVEQAPAAPRILPPVSAVSAGSVKQASTSASKAITVSKPVVRKIVHAQPKQQATARPTQVQQQRPQQQVQRRVKRQAATQKKTGGWLGLPSLSEMTF